MILITGDAYVDHPSYGAAVIGRILEKEGYRVAVIPQPDWRSTHDFKRFGRPRLFFGITAGNLDSMVSNYTASKRKRQRDSYSPAGRAGLRPDRATIVYGNRVREAFGDIPLVIGGIEASLRRFAHYDWWDNSVRRSILIDSRANILVYGMGERQVVEIAGRLEKGVDLTGIRGTAVVIRDSDHPVTTGDDRSVTGKNNPSKNTGERTANGNDQRRHGNWIHGGTIEIPSYEDVKNDKARFNEAFCVIRENQDPFLEKTILQRHGNRYVIQFPPPPPLSRQELDDVYDLPYMKECHPSYGSDKIPGLETVRFSIISHRGCCGDCSFCGLSMHQGRIIQSRSKKSILKEATLLTKRGDFRGTITDLGGPTANLYGARCRRWDRDGSCKDRTCLIPEKCGNLELGYKESMELYKSVLALPGVKHLFIESGIRYDLLVDRESTLFLNHLCKYHISGRLKVAPEHSADHVLKLMNKPGFKVYEAFTERFRETNKKLKKEQYLVNYFISAHPGATIDDARRLSQYLKKKRIHPEQIQDFIPLPLTLSGAMYYTERHPLTGKPVYSAKTFTERKIHRAFIQYKNPKSRALMDKAAEIIKKPHKRQPGSIRRDRRPFRNPRQTGKA